MKKEDELEIEVDDDEDVEGEQYDFLEHLANVTGEIAEIKKKAMAKLMFGWVADGLDTGEYKDYTFMPSPLIEGKDEDNFLTFGQWTKAIDIKKMLEQGTCYASRDELMKYDDHELSLAFFPELKWMYDCFVKNVRKRVAFMKVEAKDTKETKEEK